MQSKSYKSRKPELEAIQWTGDNTNDVLRFIFPYMTTDETSLEHNRKFFENNLGLSKGDYIIKSKRAEFYSMKPEFFEEMYEPA